MSKTNEELALEVQQLRQFCINILLYLRMNPLPEATCDHWWEKLSGYEQVVKENEQLDSTHL